MKLITLSITLIMLSTLAFAQSVEDKMVVKNITYIQDFEIEADGLSETTFQTTFFLAKDLLPNKLETVTIMVLTLKESKNGSSQIDTTYTKVKVLEHTQECDGPCKNTIKVEVKKDFLFKSITGRRYLQWQVDVPLLHHIEKDANGKIFADGFTYDGYAFGKDKYINKDGDIIEKNMLNGFEHGRSTIVRNGVIIEDENYFLGQKFGMQVERFNSGVISSEMFFFNDKEEGAATTYYKNGNKLNDLSYKQGVIHGPVVKYYENGNVLFKTTYNNGASNGEYIKYYESGKLFAEANFVNGTLHGKYKGYYESGKIKNKGVYENGVPAEGWKNYDESGNEIE